jgi:proteasome lid subunit RPN8/RPN11
MRGLLEGRAYRDLRDFAARTYPLEACGVLIGKRGDPLEILEVKACGNIAGERARDHYHLPPEDQLAVEKDARLRGLDVVGYFHSHPDRTAEASSTDAEMSWEDVAYLIVSVQDAKVVDVRGWMRSPGARAFRELDLKAH